MALIDKGSALEMVGQVSVLRMSIRAQGRSVGHEIDETDRNAKLVTKWPGTIFVRGVSCGTTGAHTIAQRRRQTMEDATPNIPTLIDAPVLRSRNRMLREQYAKLPRASRSDLPVLILGPSGSGKERVARAIHDHSFRNQAPFVSLNCSALVESLSESELFGHTKGSFSGAIADRKGAFEIARRGTLFLDEVGDLPLSLQAKLLRALENKEIRPVGSDRTVETDVRIVAATHQNLNEKIFRNEFRADLFYRLNVIQFTTLPLRDRLEDFEDIVAELTAKFKTLLSPSTIQILKNHPFPGNIRELQNMVARIAAFYPGETIEPEQLRVVLEQTTTPPPTPINRMMTHGEDSYPKYQTREKAMILECLRLHFGNQRQAAADLGMPKSTFHDKVKFYGIDVNQFKPQKSWLQDQGLYADRFQLA